MLIPVFGCPWGVECPFHFLRSLKTRKSRKSGIRGTLQLYGPVKSPHLHTLASLPQRFAAPLSTGGTRSYFSFSYPSRQARQSVAFEIHPYSIRAWSVARHVPSHAVGKVSWPGASSARESRLNLAGAQRNHSCRRRPVQPLR